MLSVGISVVLATYYDYIVCTNTSNTYTVYNIATYTQIYLINNSAIGECRLLFEVNCSQRTITVQLIEKFSNLRWSQISISYMKQHNL